MNIRYDARNKWRGQIGREKGFCKFSDPMYGLRAAAILLCRYVRQGDNTVDKIISRWAPPSENATDVYIAYVKSHYRRPHRSFEVRDSLDIYSIMVSMCEVETPDFNIIPFRHYVIDFLTSYLKYGKR